MRFFENVHGQRLCKDVRARIPEPVLSARDIAAAMQVYRRFFGRSRGVEMRLIAGVLRPNRSNSARANVRAKPNTSPGGGARSVKATVKKRLAATNAGQTVDRREVVTKSVAKPVGKPRDRQRSEMLGFSRAGSAAKRCTRLSIPRLAKCTHGWWQGSPCPKCELAAARKRAWRSRGRRNKK